MLIYLLSKFEGNRRNSLWVVTLWSVCFKRKNLFEKKAPRKTSCFANKLRPRMPSIGFSNYWANQHLESLLPLTTRWNLRANLQNILVFCNALKTKRWFFCISVLLEADLAKWGRRKRIPTLEWLGEENKQKKAQRNNCAWIIFQWISMSATIHQYRTQQKSHCEHRRYRCQVPQIFTEPVSSLDSIFLPAWYDSYSFIREANFRFFTPRCIFIRSSLFSLFRTGLRSFPWSMFTYNLIELHLIRKMHGFTTLINWVASQ